MWPSQISNKIAIALMMMRMMMAENGSIINMVIAIQTDRILKSAEIWLFTFTICFRGKACRKPTGCWENMATRVNYRSLRIRMLQFHVEKHNFNSLLAFNIRCYNTICYTQMFRQHMLPVSEDTFLPDREEETMYEVIKIMLKTMRIGCDDGILQRKLL